MNAFMNTINDGLTADAIWGAIAPIAPILLTLTLVGIGVYVLSKNLRRTRTLKGATVR